MGFTPDQLIDTGFVLFVIFTCGYSLFGKTAKGPSKKWMDELATLQEGLRELISEASAASSNLDRTLVRRKQELETLLKKLEATKESAFSTKASSRREEEFPNETWVMDRPKTPAPAGKKAAAPQPEPRVSSQDSDLARRIEVFLESKTSSRPSASEDSIDPVAYKVARRLLENGNEIHIVAKKVGLPLEEIRVLDSMIEREEKPAPTAYSRAKRVERVEESEDKWTSELTNLLEEQEDGIRRATTLL